jgi:hypothetical protein
MRFEHKRCSSGVTWAPFHPALQIPLLLICDAGSPVVRSDDVGIKMMTLFRENIG